MAVLPSPLSLTLRKLEIKDQYWNLLCSSGWQRWSSCCLDGGFLLFLLLLVVLFLLFPSLYLSSFTLSLVLGSVSGRIPRPPNSSYFLGFFYGPFILQNVMKTAQWWDWSVEFFWQTCVKQLCSKDSQGKKCAKNGHLSLLWICQNQMLWRSRNKDLPFIEVFSLMDLSLWCWWFTEGHQHCQTCSVNAVTQTDHREQWWISSICFSVS